MRATAAGAGLIAAAGMTVAGLSRSPEVFAAGILLAGAGAALSFPPVSDAVAGLEATTRGRVLSAVNCATGHGVALAVPIAIALGTQWRGAWLAFAAIALVAAAWAAWVLPRRGPPSTPAYGWRGLAWRKAAPLLAGGLLIGIGSSAYWTFAVARVVDAGSLSPSASRTFLAVVGVAGVLATGTGEAIRVLGAARAYTLLAALEAGGAALPAGAIGLGPVLLLGAAVVMAAGLFRPPPGILGT